MRNVSRAVFAALIVTWTSPAFAEKGTDAEAETQLSAGLKFRQQGKDDEALAAFTRAYAIKPSPRARAQMALAEQALGKWVLATDYLEEALAARDDAWITKHRVVLEKTLGTTLSHLGRLDVRCNVVGADVRINGEKVGTLPLATPVRLEAGEIAVEVLAPGYHTVVRRVVVRPESVGRETVELRPIVVETPLETDRPAEGKTVVPLVEHAPSPLGWVALGVGAALMGGGGVLLALRADKVSSYNEDRRCPGLDSPTQPGSCADLVSSANTMMFVGIGGLVTGGLVAGVGTYLLLTSHRKRSTENAKFDVRPTLGIGSFGLTGRFN